jgi:hypothetical protein
MNTDLPGEDHLTTSCEQFFELNYALLREQPPMKWMGRLFLRLTDDMCPSLVDLPTGAGKTDVAVIWVLALAWYGLNTATRKPVPRRLVWVVNRRVLVQQVFRLADKLKEKIFISRDDPGSPGDLHEGLARLSGDQADIFRIVQLRGQLIDDREWSVAPCVPQLIIGTVDQIGSRLLFQGYGLGKWSRPMQAALFGVDAWICVDEAHLVPAFVLTLRQFRRLVSVDCQYGPNALSAVFQRLPSWLTELSATPALPPPRADSIFRLIRADDDDPPLKNRLLAAQTRQVRITWLTKDVKPEEAMGNAAAGFDGRAETVAVFVREPRVANNIANRLEKQFKKRTLKVTGRLRGYERDRIQHDPVFERFGPPGEGDGIRERRETVFLVGTSAAEVGLDADAAAIVCDFASLPTLLQRLGRLDRRGCLSRGFRDGQTEAPIMRVFATPEEINDDIQERMLKLAQALRDEESDFSASLLVAVHWRDALVREEKRQVKEVETDEGTAVAADKGEDAKEADPREIVSAATWAVLLGGLDNPSVNDVCTNPPSTWLESLESCVTGGPVAVPPLTLATIEHWSGTTKSRNAFVPVHPFLYGIQPDVEGMPLVGVAFRLEMDALAAAPFEGEEEEEEEFEERTIGTQVEEIFRRFPPRRAELHFVPISIARDWLAEVSPIPVAHFDGEEWTVTSNHNDSMFLRPDAILILPTLAGTNESLTKVLEDGREAASRDVLEGVSTERPSYWRRVVEVESGDYRLKSQDGASRIDRVRLAEELPPGVECTSVGDRPPGPMWRPQLRVWLRIGTAKFRFEYWKPKSQVQPRQPLEDHLARAGADSGGIAASLAPGNQFLRSLLVEGAKVHDAGKRNPKWQRAMGNADVTNPVAKPLVERPASTGGFRHEWESLL